MTSRDGAILALWEANKHLPPAERIKIIERYERRTRALWPEQTEAAA